MRDAIRELRDEKRHLQNHRMLLVKRQKSAREALEGISRELTELQVRLDEI